MTNGLLRRLTRSRGQHNLRSQRNGLMHLFLFEENAEGVDAALLIVLITIFTAALALQMERFGADAAQMLDRAQQFAVQSMGIRAQGETVAAYGWSDVYRQWLEWDSRTTLAQAEGDEAAASRYRAVRDRAVALTPCSAVLFLTAPAASHRTSVQSSAAASYTSTTPSAATACPGSATIRSSKAR